MEAEQIEHRAGGFGYAGKAFVVRCFDGVTRGSTRAASAGALFTQRCAKVWNKRSVLFQRCRWCLMLAECCLQDKYSVLTAAEREDPHGSSILALALLLDSHFCLSTRTHNPPHTAFAKQAMRSPDWDSHESGLPGDRSISVTDSRLGNGIRQQQ